MHDPFANHKLRYELVDRGYLTEEEVLRIMKKHFDIERLELVKNIFIFSCFTGLAYIDVYNLTYDKIVTVEDRQWLITKRYKTSVDENVMLLDIPLAIIRKYYDINRKGGKVFSYDEQPAYQLIFERNCRPLWHKKESDLPHGKAYFRHYVYIQRGTNGVCIKDAWTYKYQNNSDLCTNNKQES